MLWGARTWTPQLNLYVPTDLSAGIVDQRLIFTIPLLVPPRVHVNLVDVYKVKVEEVVVMGHAEAVVPGVEVLVVLEVDG